MYQAACELQLQYALAICCVSRRRCIRRRFIAASQNTRTHTSTRMYTITKLLAIATTIHSFEMRRDVHMSTTIQKCATL